MPPPTSTTGDCNADHWKSVNIVQKSAAEFDERYRWSVCLTSDNVTVGDLMKLLHRVAESLSAPSMGAFRPVLEYRPFETKGKVYRWSRTIDHRRRSACRLHKIRSGLSSLVTTSGHAD